MALFIHEAFSKTSGCLENTKYFLTFHYAPQNCAITKKENYFVLQNYC